MISFSIIIPVYNAEAALPRLCRSIESQTLAPSEVLFVEDGSTDESRSLLETITEGHPTWKLIVNPENLGLSESRNRGIQAAKGTHILFMDADDWIEPTLLEKVSLRIEQYQPDILAFGVSEDFLDKHGKVTYSASHAPNLSIADREHPWELADMIYMLEEKTIYGYAWNKIYRRDFLQQNHLFFRKISFIEDILFNRKAFDLLSRAVTIPNILYHYVNADPAGRLTEKYLPDYFDLQKRRYQEFLDQQYAMRGKEDERSLTLMSGRYFRSFASMTVREMNHGRPSAEVQLMIEKEMQESRLYQLLQPHLHCSSFVTRFLYQPFCDGNAQKALRHMRCFRWMKSHSGNLYDRLKQIR
jgi:glycosyltransferase involved in cell wall biosynthesis